MRPTPPSAAPAAPTTTPARTGRGGAAPTASPEKARGGFDQLVDRYADAREDAATDTSVDTRGREPRAKDKDDADPAAAPATEPTTAPVAPQTTFPWTLPLSPSWWRLEATPDGSGDAEGGQQTDAVATAAGAAAIGAASAATIEVGIGGTQLAAALSASLTAGAAATTGAAGAGDAKDDAGAAAFDATLNQAAGQIDASPKSVVAAAPSDALADARIDLAISVNGVNGKLATNVDASHDIDGEVNASGVAGGAGEGAAQAAAAGDTLSLATSLDAIVKAGANATTTIDASQQATTGASTPAADQIQAALDAAANANASTNAQAGADAGAVTSMHASAQADGAVNVDHARQQAIQELQQAFARARAAAEAAAEAAAQVASNGAQNQANVSVTAQGAIATDTPVATNVDGLADVKATSHVDVAVAVQARETGPRAAKHAEHAVDSNAWAAAVVTGAATAEQASGGSTDGNGTTGRGRDSHPDTFGSVVSSLRHASDGGASMLPPAFEARGLMAAALNAGVDSPLGNADGASATIVTTAPAEEQAAQIVRSMRLHWRGSVGEAQLRLTPEHLGQVLVSVRVDQGSVTATMHAETPAAQQWIQAHQQQLRDALDAQGLRVAQLQVTTDPEDRPRRDPSQEQQQQQQSAHTRARGGQGRTRDGEAPRFEIRM